MATPRLVRSDWAIRPVRAAAIPPQQHLFVHHTTGGCGDASFPARLRCYEEFHVSSRGMVNGAYGEMAQHEGLQIAEFRGYGRAGGHTLNWNTRSNACCADGNFEIEVPGDRLIEAIADSIVGGIRRGEIWSNVIIGGHRDVYPTACPGRHLYARIPDIRRLVAQGGGPSPSPTPEPTRSQIMAQSMYHAGHHQTFYSPATGEKKGALLATYDDGKGSKGKLEIYPPGYCASGDMEDVTVSPGPGTTYEVSALDANGQQRHHAYWNGSKMIRWADERLTTIPVPV